LLAKLGREHKLLIKHTGQVAVNHCSELVSCPLGCWGPSEPLVSTSEAGRLLPCTQLDPARAILPVTLAGVSVIDISDRNLLRMGRRTQR
jgi:hypothetical protein